MLCGPLCTDVPYMVPPRRGLVAPQGNAVLTLGQHRLDGKVAPLKKPLAVMAKRPASEEGQPPVYEVVAVISQKYVFKNRPQPIISDDAKFHAIGKSERP